MVRKRAIAWIAAGLAASAALGGGATAGQRAVLQVLGRVGEGRWELRDRDGGPVTSLCIGDRRRLIQLRHPDLACNRLILEDGPNSLTVQYTCHGRGYGRTHIRMETPQLLQIESQGISDGLPFDFALEGRYAGACSG